MKKLLIVILAVLLTVGIGVGVYCLLTQERSAHEHQLGEWVLTKEATCLEDGVRERKCACGYSVKETVKTTGHEYGDWVVTVKPTCTTQGIQTRICMVCDYLEEDTVQSVGHRLDHIITTTEGSSTTSYPQCGNCGTVMDTGYEYVREKEQQESYIKNCPRDFSFDVQYDGTEDNIYGNMIIVSEEYVYGMTNEEIFASSIERIEYVVSEKDDGVWTVSPAGAYLENKNYVAVITEKLTFCDHWGQRLSFRIDGPVVQEVVFNQNIVYLASFETMDPGYFPYTLAYDEETEQYQLVLSKVGIFDESFLGQILCVGQSMNDAEVFSSSGQCVFGKIVSVSEENGKAILRLDAPEFSEVFDKLNIQNGSGVSLNENSFDEDFVDLMYAKFISSDGFIEALATVQTAADKYAEEKGWKIDPINIDKKYFTLTITSDLVNDTVKDSAGDEVEQIKIAFTFEFSPKITMYDSSEADGIKTELNVSITLKVDSYFYPTACAEKYETGPNKGDYYIHLDIDQRTVFDFAVNVSFKVLYDEVQESIYILNEDAQKIHTIHCAHGKNLKHFRKMTFGDVKREFGNNYTEYECKRCKPFSLTTNSFVVLKDKNGSKVLHCMGCSYIKKADNYQEIESYMIFPGSGYKTCSSCFAGVDMEEIGQNAFEAYMEECFKNGDWVENYDKLKECANGALEESKKGSLSGKPQSIYEQDAVVSLKIFGVFNLGFYFDIEMDFELEVTLKYHLVQQTGRTHSVHLGKNAKGIYMPSTHSKEKDPKEIIGGEDFEEINTLNIQGKASVEFGIRVAMKLSTVISDKWAYIGIDAGVGLYMELSGVLNVDYARDDEEDESFYAAYLDIGCYYDLNYRAYIKWLYEEGEKSLLKKTKIPFYKGGDNRAYYKYSDYEKEIVVDSDSIVLKNDLLKVHYFDLVEMKDKEDTLSIYGKSDEYSVDFDFFDKSGKKVDYCEVDYGVLVVAEDAPTVFDITMRITVVDERVPDSLAGYFAQKISRNDINGAYFLDSLDVRVHRNTEYNTMKILYVTPTTDIEIMEGEEVTFTIIAGVGVKHGVAFYYHDYQDELARFHTMADSYTITIPDAGKHMITVYPLDENGDPIKGEGLGMSYRYVTVLSNDRCAPVVIKTADHQTINQRTPFTIRWDSSNYPTENVVYSVYLQNDTAGKYTLVAQGVMNTEVTIPADMLTDVGSYSVQVYAEHESYKQSDAATLIFSVKASTCQHKSFTETVLKSPTCQQEGLVRKTCRTCDYSWEEKLATTSHKIVSVPDKPATCTGTGWRNRKQCSVCDYITQSEALDRLSHSFKNGFCVGCGTPETPQGRHPSPSFITSSKQIKAGQSLRVSWNPPEVSHGLKMVYNVRIVQLETANDVLAGELLTANSFTIPGSYFSREGSYSVDLYAKAEGYSWSYAVSLSVTVIENDEPETEEPEEPDEPQEGGFSFSSKGDGTCVVALTGNWTSKVVTFPSVSPDGDKVTVISSLAMAACLDARYVIIPESVTVISYGAFFGCTHLHYVSYRGSEKDWNKIQIFGKNDALLDADIEYNYGHVHDFRQTARVDSTCTKDGYIKFSCSCGETYKIVMVAPGEHSYSQKVYPPTYLEDGYTYYECSRCGDDYYDDIIPHLNFLHFVSNGDGTCYINGLLPGVDVYAIPGFAVPLVSPEGERVTSIADQAFMGFSGLKSIVISENVESIGNEVFRNCGKLESIVIPQNVISIGKRVFDNCENLVSITVAAGNPVYHSDGNCLIHTSSKQLVAGCKTSMIPTDGSVTVIGEYAFFGCDGLTCIEIPSVVTSIGAHAFSYCDSLEEIKLPQSLTHISKGLFAHCSALKYLPIPDSVTSIGDEAFYWCTSLTEVVISDKWETIGKDVFSYCQGLTSVIIPTGLRVIPEGLFSGCELLESITIPKDTEIISNRAFSSTGLTEVFLPSSVTEIGNYAFKNCEELKRINISKNITFIGSGAFDGCSSLEELILDDGLSMITDGAFSGCDGLRSITIPGSVKIIGGNAFSHCENLTQITISQGVEEICERAFGYCDSLTSVRLPDSLHTLGSYAFYECVALPEITIPKSIRQFGDSTFGGCISLTTITFAEGLETIGESAFSNCTALTEICLPESLKSIGESAFENCSSLINIEFAEGLETIGAYAFTNCVALETIDLPGSLLSIEESAFEYCTSLEFIIIPDNVSIIAAFAFSGCHCIRYVSLGNKITNVYMRAFDNNVSLTDVYYRGSEEQWELIVFEDEPPFPETVTYHFNADDNDNPEEIEFEILYQSNNDGTCSVIGFSIPNEAYVVIPEFSPSGDRVTSIGRGAFSDCKVLIEVTLPTGLERIEVDAFFGCSNLECVILPSTLAFVGSDAFDGCYLACFHYPGTEDEWYDNVYVESGNSCLTDNIVYNSFGEDSGDEDGPGGVIIPPESGQEAKLVFKSNGDGTCTLVDVIFSSFGEQRAIIPEYSPEGERVTVIGSNAFNKGTIMVIYIPTTIKQIEDSAFSRGNIAMVAYQGSEREWLNIKFGKDNEALNNAHIFFMDGMTFPILPF